MFKLFRRLRKDQKGAALPEYAVLLGLLLAISIGVLSSMGTSINTIFGTVNTYLTNAAAK